MSFRVCFTQLVHVRIVDLVVQPERLVPIAFASAAHREVLRAARPAPADRPFARLVRRREVRFRVRREPERLHCARRDARMEVLARDARAAELRLADAQEADERRERAEGRDGVLEPPEGDPHGGGDDDGGERGDGEREAHREDPDAHAGEQAVHELVLRDLVPGVPDRPAGALELVHADEGRDEDGQPKDEPWDADREQDGRPCEADEHPPEDRAPCERPSDPVVFDPPAHELVLVCLAQTSDESRANGLQEENPP